MAYLGNTPAARFSSMQYQDLTGGTGTSFTLDHAVGNEQEIEVFVNNVRQEPSVAYTVSGTALTMTGSIVATDVFYVVFQGLAQQTATHPSNQALQATSGTFSGAVSAASATVTGDLTVDTNTLYVDSTNNNVGIGTGSPNMPLHISNSTDGNLVNLYTTGTGGGAAQLTITGASNLIKMTTGGSDALAFETSGSNERMRIDNNGNVALNGSVRDSSRFTINGNVSNPNLQSWQNTTSGVTHFWFRNPNGIVGSIVTSGSSTAYNTSSDYRLKTAVTYDWDATTRLKQLRPARFEWIADGEDAVPVDGFLAHEVQDVVPEAITGTHNEVDDEGNPVYQGIDQSKLVPLLVKTIQELEARIAALEAN